MEQATSLPKELVPMPLPKEIVPYLPLMPIAITALLAFALSTLSYGSLFSFEQMARLPDARYGTAFFLVAILDFLFVAFFANKAFGNGSQVNMQFAPAAYAACELPAILGFALAFVNESSALFTPFALISIIYAVYVFSKSRSQG